MDHSVGFGGTRLSLVGFSVLIMEAEVFFFFFEVTLLSLFDFHNNVRVNCNPIPYSEVPANVLPSLISFHIR